jgi:hypothetical protein
MENEKKKKKLFMPTLAACEAVDSWQTASLCRIQNDGMKTHSSRQPFIYTYLPTSVLGSSPKNMTWTQSNTAEAQVALMLNVGLSNKPGTCM